MNVENEFDDIFVDSPPTLKEGFVSESVPMRPIERVVSRTSTSALISESTDDGAAVTVPIPEDLDDASSDEETQDDKAVRKRLESTVTDSRRATMAMGKKPRKNTKAAQHLTNTGHQIDYILVGVLPDDEEERAECIRRAELPPSDDDDKEVKKIRKRKRFLKNLEKAGFEVEKEVAPDGETLFYKVHGFFPTLIKQAESMKLKKNLTKEATSVLENINTKVSVTSRVVNVFNPWNYFQFLRPDVPEDPKTYAADFLVNMKDEFQGIEDEDTFFIPSERSEMVWTMLKSIPYGKKVTQIGIQRLLANGTFTAAFPLHDGPYKDGEEGDEAYDMGIPRNDRKTLFAVWGQLKKSFIFQPYDLIKRYFGVKIGLYFAWLGYYTVSLIIPGILGFIVFLHGLVSYRNRQDTQDVCDSNFTMCPLCDDGCDTWLLNSTCVSYGASYFFDNEVTIFFAIVMSLWGSAYIDFWKRRNAQLAYDWNVLEFSEEEPNRPQFKGIEIRKNPITGKEEKYYPFRKRVARQFGGLSTMVMMCALVLTIVFSIIVYRLAVRAAIFAHDGISAQEASTYTAISAAALNLCGIILMNQLYQRIAVKLTDWENYQKDSQYEAALTFKIFLFSFVNSFSSIFYIAFFKGKFVGRPGDYNTIFGFRQDECPPYGCMLELTIQLVIIMVGRQIINNVLEMFLPIIKRKIKEWRAPKELKENNRRLLPWEREYLSLAPLPQFGLFHEYLEMVIQFGFLTLFISAFSLAPFFALLNNILEIRIDANKFLTVYRRVPGLRASNLGIWDEVMAFLSYFSVVTNGLVIAFSSNFISREVWRVANGSLVGYVEAIYPLSPVTDTNSPFYNCHYFGLRDADGNRGQFFFEVVAARLGFLIIFEHFIFICKYIIQWAIPDVPKSVQLAIKREEYLAELALQRALATSEDDAPTTTDTKPAADDDDDANEDEGSSK